MVYDSIEAALDGILASSGSVAASELAEAAGVSRQAAHRRLSAGVAAGALRVEGRGRSTRYLPAGLTWSWPREGLEEHRAWLDVAASPPVARLGEEAARIAAYAFSEMVNNAIDHSGGTRVAARVEAAPGRVHFVVEDDGVGAFEHVRSVAGLPDELAAVQEISKGRFTTDPTRHTGEGLFFTSKAAARFELRSGTLAWIVDNARGEAALLEAEPRVGTRVSFTVADPPARPIVDVFDEYTEDLEFVAKPEDEMSDRVGKAELVRSFPTRGDIVRTRTVVKLFEYGREFVSRSEAKRLLAGLERFRDVIVDFTGVTGIGQGFADEVFRVWPAAHPETRVRPENMSRTVEFMVRRAGG